ncbi:MAG: exo-alpha-sialidase [Planctomycetes bacterium]|nr:exo-alpha-sialidase [Planctomycetota bacterium]
MVCSASLFAITVAAQVPAHAVQLDPTTSIASVGISLDGDRVLVVGRTQMPNLGFVHIARSSDGGRTWPIRELPIAYASLVGTLVAAGASAHVVLNEYWVGPHVVSSYDGGATWQPPVRVSAVSNSFLVYTPHLTVDGNELLVAWVESRAVGGPPARPVLLVNRSVDGGRTWASSDTVVAGPTAATQIFDTKLLAVGSTRHLLWGQQDATGLAQTLHSRSLDGGATWTVGRVLGPVRMVRAAGSAQVLLVADSSGATLQRSLDGGVTWLPVVGHGIQNVADLAVHGRRVLLVGNGAAQQPALGTILLQMSADGGATWLPQPFAVLRYRPASVQAVVAGDAAFVHFGFDGSQEPRGAVIQSDDGGVTWRLVVDAGGLGFAADLDRAVVVAKGPAATPSAWAFVMAGHTARGVGTAGSGGIVPTLQGRGLPGRGRTFQLEVEGCVGGGQGLLAGGFGSPVDLPFGSARLHVPQPMLAVPFLANGVSGLPGAGGASVAVVVPNSAAVVGLQLVSQAFVLDGGAVGGDGFAATAARETWIR